MAWAAILIVVIGLWTASNFYSLVRNYLSARKIGAPMFIIPFNIYNPVWMVAAVPLVVPLEKYIPASWYRGLNLATYGFEFRSKEDMFGEEGNDTVVLVTSGPVEVSVRDPEVSSEILKRLKDFPVTDVVAVILNVFGSNLVSTNGEDWARQRKLIAPNINEKISKLVFGESVSQARQMLSSYMGEVKGVTDETLQGMKTIAINVLGTVGFGISQPWKQGEAQKPEKGFRHTYMEATRTVVENIIEAAVIPAKLLTTPLFAPSWQAIGHAKNEFPIHTKRMLARERELQRTTSETRSNLMSILVKIADGATASVDTEKTGGRVNESEKEKRVLRLSEEEVLGNLFIFTSAGFDTTANTMAYALTLLATYPKWQDWLYEEISTVLLDKDPDNLEYSEVYPKLPRCLALMYETLRLFPPLTHIARQTSKDHDVTITTSKNGNGDTRTHFFPRGTIVYINTVALGLDTRTWGSDAKAFRPSRWLVDASVQPGDSNATILNVKTPARGTFLAWASGPRACPGMKMSQVEFVSVFMTIFGQYRCEPVRIHDDETDAQVEARLEEVLQHSQPKLTLQMMRNKDLKVKWIKK
ncbi:uncharacterized protein A1O9_12130 [Exophiala aquamarina CBS 119918]|uniref:Cytochrome P450 oxidoreductase n=1 Tax=Exophiala aquamarina CBS 119918 TaxID=1182545 RepID=A0A072NXR5_9EURO|nr:uncharacterized protein A1O9_12130 [Exophiala aquamarina CBS 119918]KEF51793.1 hypothetical protein A1O9_12130 [Exophiala aquamarina CBS 119918]